MTIMVQCKGSPYAFEHWDIETRDKSELRHVLNHMYSNEWISAWTHGEDKSFGVERLN